MNPMLHAGQLRTRPAADFLIAKIIEELYYYGIIFYWKYDIFF
jgi:hypothetical protein